MNKGFGISKKQCLLLAIMVSLHGVGHATSYTSTVTSGQAWNQAWNPSTPTPVAYAVSGVDETYTFAGNSSYTGKTGLIVNTARNIKIVADSGSLTFDGWNIGNANYVVDGYGIDIGSNTTFSNITGGAIRASGSASGPGGSANIVVGSNVTFNNISSDVGGSNYGGAMYIFGPNSGVGQGTFGENFTISNVSFVDTSKASPYKGGGGIGVRRSMDLTFGNNSWFENNKVQATATSGAAQGGAISGVGNTEGVKAQNTFTFNGNTTFKGNQAIATGTGGFAQGGAIGTTKANLTLMKTAEVIFNGGTGTVTISGNIANAAAQARGGAIFVGDGNLYIEAANIVIANNKGIAGTNGSFGGAIYTSTTDKTTEARGNVTIVGNATITGNIASSVSSSAVGGAIYADGNVNLRPNLATNKIVFRDNQAASEGAGIHVNTANRKLWFDYVNGGTIELYDRFNILDGSQTLQTGNGLTRIWSDSWGGNININSGGLAIESAVSMANTIDGTMTTYGAGRLSGYNVNLGTVTTSMKLDVYDGGRLFSGLTTAGYAMNISSENTISLYGSGSINYDSNITDGFSHFGSDRVINMGSDNSVNLAARTAAQIAAGVQNTRGTDGTSFTALHLNNMGSNNTIGLNTDIANNVADKIVVTTTATGANYIKVGYDPTIMAGGGATETTKTLVVEAAVGSLSSNLLGTFTGAATDIGVYKWTPKVIKEGDNWYIVGDPKPPGPDPKKPSTPVETIEEMTRAMMSGFRVLNDDLLKRMGELRFNPNKAGVWVRTHTGESDLQGGGSQHHTVVQGGIDSVKQEKGGKRVNGVALEYFNGSNSFKQGRGHTNIYDLALYQAWLGNKGHYYDLVGKVYNTSNSMDVRDTEGTLVHGDYRSWAYGTSFEYGYRKELKNGYFVTPQAQLSYSHMLGANYKTSNNISINQSSFNSLIGRLGVTIGRKYNNESQVYLTANVLREFMANARLHAADTLGNRLQDNISGKETWFNLVLGATIRQNKTNDWYVEIERDFGSKTNKRWQVQVGSRWSW